MTPSTRPPLVCVVIPCYNQGPFLSEAIDSVLAQTYPSVEIVVVDDGSTDGSPEVIARYPRVRVIRQVNQGLAAARNTGLRASNGSYLLFLDADDRLLPRALEAGVRCLDAHPDCAFVAGRYRDIASDGSPAAGSPPAVDAESDWYLAMLRRNQIGMHATVMYRRTVFDDVGGFDTSLRAAEDYELYLRICRSFPIYCHQEVVAEYRRHGGNMSEDAELMLTSTLAVLRSQWQYVEGSNDRQRAYERGIRFYKELYGRQLLKQAWLHTRTGREWREALRAMSVVMRHYPQGIVSQAGRKLWRLRRRS